MGGFPHYGVVSNDYVMLKGQCVGIRKRTLLLRQSLFPPVLTGETGNINLKFIDTSSKYGHGRFQTRDEKTKYFGKVKVGHDRKVINKDLHKTRLARIAEESEKK